MADRAEMSAALTLEQAPFQQGLQMASNAADKFANNLTKSMGHLGATIAGAFAFDKIIGGFEHAIQKGAQIGELAERFDVSAESLQKIGNAASLSGSSMEDVANAMNKLAKNAGSALAGNERLQQTFERIGVSVADLAKMTPEELFLKLADAVKSGSLGSQDFAVAMELAGKNAGVLMNTLRMGSEEITKVGESMGVFSDATVDNLKRAEDAMKRFQNYSTIFFGSILDGFMSLAEELSKNPLNFFDWEKLESGMDKTAKARTAARRAAGSRSLGGDADFSGEAGSGDASTSRRRTSSDRMDSARDKGIEDAYRIAAKFENEQLDRGRKMKDEQAAQDEKDAADVKKQQAEYMQKQNAVFNFLSARQDEATAKYYAGVAATDSANAQINSINERFGGLGLDASRRGQQYMNQARRQQANQNRMDNYKFGDEQVQSFVDRMRTRGSGQTFEEFNRYSNLPDDAAREAARRDLAAKRAQQENPSLRDQQQKSLTDVYKLLDDNLKEMRTYAHVK